METYYTKKEYNEMKSILNRKLKSAEKKIKSLEQKIHSFENPIKITMELGDLAEKETHVTED